MTTPTDAVVDYITLCLCENGIVLFHLTTFIELLTRMCINIFFNSFVGSSLSIYCQYTLVNKVNLLVASRSRAVIGVVIQRHHRK